MMYGFLWRHLPGTWPFRLLQLAALAVGALALLFYVIFPAVDPHLPFNRVTVNDGPSQQGPTPTLTPGPASLSGGG